MLKPDIIHIVNHRNREIILNKMKKSVQCKMKLFMFTVLLLCSCVKSTYECIDLGYLSLLPGTWKGTGFNIIALPNGGTQRPDYRVIAQNIDEEITFTPIMGPVPNRGSMLRHGNKRLSQEDIDIYALTYIQLINTQGNLIHVENGMWLNVPPTNLLPCKEATIVRQSSVPHGDVLLAQSTLITVIDGPPHIYDIDCYPIGDRPISAGYLDPYIHVRLPEDISYEQFRNPNLILYRDIQDDNIIETIIIKVTTRNDGGVLNIPNVERNADVTYVDYTMWIETILRDDGYVEYQLQYSQTVILNFQDFDWPHITVGTLRKI